MNAQKLFIVNKDIYMSNILLKAMEYGCSDYGSELIRSKEADMGFDLYLF